LMYHGRSSSGHFASLPDSSAPVESDYAERTWRYALYGGLVSIPLTVGVNWYSAVGSEFSLNMVTVGGLIAGYLAQRASLDVRAVGIRVGLIGAIPGIVQLFPQLSRVAADVSAPWPLVPAIVAASMLSVMVLGIGALGGLVGSIIGGWLADRI